MAEKYNVIIEQGEDGYIVSDVLELHGCHTQAKTYDELIKRTKEAIILYLSVKKKPLDSVKFVGLLQIEVLNKFYKDLDKITVIKVKEDVADIIEEIEKAGNIREIRNIKKLKSFL